jgi:hypothetical protein
MTAWNGDHSKYIPPLFPLLESIGSQSATQRKKSASFVYRDLEKLSVLGLTLVRTET